MKLALTIYLFIALSIFGSSQSDSNSIEKDSCKIILSWDYPDGYWDKFSDSILVTDLGPIPDCTALNCNLTITSACILNDYHLQFFNRWGELLFETKNQNEGWNAFDQPDGVYIWWLKGAYPSGEKFEHKGHVTLLK